MPVLLALAGFVVFLCVFGTRGLKIAGAVFGVAGVVAACVIGGGLVWLNYASNAHKAERNAALQAPRVVASAGPLVATCASEYAPNTPARRWCEDNAVGD
jgi:hypothetical protein